MRGNLSFEGYLLKYKSDDCVLVGSISMLMLYLFLYFMFCIKEIYGVCIGVVSKGKVVYFV